LLRDKKLFHPFDGGNLSYTFVSFNPGNNTYTYTVELRIYRYCATGSSGLDDTVFMGAYYESASLSKTLAQTVPIPLVSQQFITPPNPNPNCSFASNVCVEEGVYRTNMVLGRRQPVTTSSFSDAAETITSQTC
jgi:hypothetical protein